MPNPSNTSNSSASAADFLKLAAESGLFTPQQCRQLHVQYQQAAVGAAADSAQPLAQWLVSQKHLSRFQAKVLLSGKPGPFLYGTYKVVERISEGPLRGCFRGVHVSSGHPVLMQFLTAETVRDPRRWMAVAAGLTRISLLDHPSLYRWYEWVDLGNFKFLVAEDVPGRPLANLIAEGRLDADRACYFAQQAAQGLQQVHQAGFLHRDVRPEHLWIAKTGELKVLLQPLLAETRLTAPEPLVQADYRAPELANPQRAADVLTDIYALGCTLFQMLTGRPPFAGGDETSKMQRHAAEAIQPLDAFGVPPQVTQVVAYMMAKNPAVRFKQMAEVAQQLSPLAGAQAHLLPPTMPLPTLPGYLEYLEQQPWKAAAAPVASPATSAVSVPTSAPLAIPLAQPAGAPLAVAQPIAAPLPTAPVATQPFSQPMAPRIPIEIRTEDLRRRRGTRSRGRNVVIFAVIALVAAVGVLLGWQYYGGTFGGSRGPSAKQAGDHPTGNIGSAGSDASSSSSAAGMADDGRSLWASPTSGAPIDFAGVPRDSRLTIYLRPAELLAHPEGERLLQALGPAVQALWGSIESVTQVPLADTEQLILSVHNAKDEGQRVAMVVRPREPLARDELFGKWGQPEAKNSPEGNAYFEGATWSYYLPSGTDPEQIQQFTVGSVAEIQAVAEVSGAPPDPYKGMEPVLRASDSQRLMSLFFVTHFLRSNLLQEGREFYFGDATRLREPIDAFLGNGVRGGMLSVHLSDHCYLEMVLSTDVSRDRYSLAEDVRQNIREFPRQIEDYLAMRINPATYWRKVALRLPAMMQFLGDSTRIDVESKLVVANAVLPDVAAHNLAFGAEMLLASLPSDAPQVAQQPAGPKTIDELLQQKTTIRFDRTSLEFALQDIVNDVRDTYPRLPFEFDIKIVNADFEKGSITRNQAVADFQVENQPIADVLTALARRCNPITTVQDPSEPEQTLVWVVADDPEQAGRRIVLFTTREGAANRNNPLPPAFQPKP